MLGKEFADARIGKISLCRLFYCDRKGPIFGLDERFPLRVRDHAYAYVHYFA